MEYMGIVALAFIFFLWDDISKLKKQVKKIVKKDKRGENDMSEIISKLVGKKCVIDCEDAYSISKKTEVVCVVEAVDEDWIQIKYQDKNSVESTHIIRIESITTIKMM